MNEPPKETPTPRFSRTLRRFTNPLYRFFDWLYGSGHNPLYRSGTLACGFLFVLLITGLYLSFFYSVSKPYESIVHIQNQVWMGRWVRALHRYATVATVIAIFFHILQLLAQGKSWGPRTLAWVSGVLLTGMFFVSAWSGYVMVWDRHGQKVAIAGAELLALFPFLHDVVRAAFDGSAEIPPGFFFMNLFLHVAVPVAMIMFLWVHTARLSRSVWFPTRSIFIGSTLAILAVSILAPAPLLEPADLLRIVGRIPTDISTGFWLNWRSMFGLWGSWTLWLLPALILLTIPWWWRPRPSEKRPISKVDPERCTGCIQCTRDCPYEAIKMIPRPDGKRLIAEIIPDHCVSCGICAASCADFAIGPPGRTALDQAANVRDFCVQYAEPESLDIVVIACTNNINLLDRLRSFCSPQQRAVLYPVECCGCMHTEVIEQLLGISKGVALIGCPARNCFNRDGGDLLAQRIFEKRVPFLDRRVDRSRILVTAYSEAESAQVSNALELFRARLRGAASHGSTRSCWPQRVRAFITSAALVSLCAFAAQAPFGTDPDHALIRVAGLLPAFSAESCRPPSGDEVAGIPLHMRPKEVCTKTPLRYSLSIEVDGHPLHSETLEDPYGRVDRSLFLELEKKVAPGHRLISISLVNDQRKIECRVETTVRAAEIFLAHYNREQGVLRCGQGNDTIPVESFAAASGEISHDEKE